MNRQNIKYENKTETTKVLELAWDPLTCNFSKLGTHLKAHIYLSSALSKTHFQLN